MIFEQFRKLNPTFALSVERSNPKPLTNLSEWSRQHKLNTVNVVFGVGIGLYPHFKGSKFALVESVPALMKAYLESEEGKELMQDPDAFLVGIDSSSLKMLSWAFAKDQMQVLATPNRSFESLAEDFLYQSAEIKQVLHEYFEGGLVFYKNYYKNLEILPTSLDASKLFGAFEGRPAIICGAGPSLQKNVEQLKDLQSSALIFAGGSALNALFSAGVMPHFGVGVDPNATQYYRLMSHGAKGIPFFYRGRMHSEALESIYGPKLYLRGAGGYETASWFEEELAVTGEVLDEGHNVVNFSIEIARALGCNPIIFVGLDLAYSEMKTYAKGVVENPEISEEEIKVSGSYETEGFLRPAANGGSVYTTWKWVAESEWIADFQKKHPSLKLINATEGGLLIPGIEHAPLNTQTLDKIPDLKSFISNEVTSLKPFPISDKDVKDVKALFAKSLERAIELIGEIQNSEEGSTEFILAESDLEEEPCWGTLLRTFDKVFTMHQELKLRTGAGESKWEFLQQIAELNLKTLHL